MLGVLVGITTTVILFCSHWHQIEGDIKAGKMSPLVRLGTAKACEVSTEWSAAGLAIGSFRQECKHVPSQLVVASQVVWSCHCLRVGHTVAACLMQLQGSVSPQPHQLLWRRPDKHVHKTVGAAQIQLYIVHLVAQHKCGTTAL
eukprot:GHRR01010996.1.p1 GENE.GHRR01010996.1~~GHRR01010996.1.p1  ORF type:complete len:144 (-),score=28.36 GHRR01010996.1:307-738(-)